MVGARSVMRSMMTLVSALLSARSAGAQSPVDIVRLPERLSAYMAPYLEMRDFSGRILVAYHDSVVIDTAFTAPGDAVSNSDTRFGIGSITKTFTAAAIGLLAERGTLRLADAVGRFVPELHTGGQITILQLLTHSAGVPDYYVQPEYARLRATPITLDAFARWIGEKPLDFAPGTRSSYSNSGYALLALVVSRASGRPYEEFVRTELLEPAGLGATGQLAAARGTLALGHNPAAAPAFLQPPVPFDLSWLAGSGSMYSTTRDLLRWVQVLRSDRLFQFSKSAYPFGWGTRTLARDSVLEQTARIPAGYTSQITVNFTQGVTIIILSDIQADVVTRIRDDITAMIAGRPYALPILRPRRSIPDAGASAYVGRYEFAPGVAVQVRSQQGELELAGPDGDFLPLEPIAPNRFFFRPLYVTVEFGRDSTGRGVLIWDGGATAVRASP